MERIDALYDDLEKLSDEIRVLKSQLKQAEEKGATKMFRLLVNEEYKDLDPSAGNEERAIKFWREQNK